jgi:hypothetical protein
LADANVLKYGMLSEAMSKASTGLKSMRTITVRMARPMRLINADSLLEAIKTGNWLPASLSGLSEAVKHYAEVMIQLEPTVEAYEAWIPVNLRLPKDGDEVLVCFNTPEHRISIETYSRRLGRFSSLYDMPVAWRPLPKPYEGKGEYTR